MIDNCNGPPIENGPNNVCLHPLSYTFASTSQSKNQIEGILNSVKDIDLNFVRPKLDKIVPMTKLLDQSRVLYIIA